MVPEPEEDNMCTPPELSEIAKQTTSELLPKKSKILYDKAYNKFQAWRRTKQAGVSENVMLAYFTELSKMYRPPSLYSTFSFLKSTMKLYDDIDINTYKKVLAFLKRFSEGYVPKKSKVLTEENIRNFICIAPDNVYLATKVAMIFAIMGALRCDELKSVKMNHLEYHGDNLILVHIPDTKTKQPKSFTILGDFLKIVKQYLNLRPAKVEHDRVFVNYQKGVCTIQPIGKNKFAAMPKEIAKFLNLPEADLYTGHSFRRSSTTVLANAGGDITTIKRHGKWSSTKVAESYIEDSIASKKKTATLIGNAIQFQSDESETVTPLSFNTNSKLSKFSKQPSKVSPPLLKNNLPCSNSKLSQSSQRKFTYKTPIFCHLPIFSQPPLTEATGNTEILSTSKASSPIQENNTDSPLYEENIERNEDLSVSNFVVEEDMEISPSNFIVEEYCDTDCAVQESIPMLNLPIPSNFNFSFNNCSVTVNVTK